MKQRYESDLVMLEKIASTLRGRDVGCDTIAPTLKPVEVVAEHQHEVVARR